MLKLVEKLTDLNARFMLGLSIICLLLAMVLVSADAISRKFGYALPGGVPITELFVAGLVFGGIVYAQANGVHLHVGILDGVLPRRGIVLTDYFGLLVGFVAIGIITWYGFAQAFDSWLSHEASDDKIKVPFWPSRFVLALGSLLLCLQFVLDATRLYLTGKMHRSLGNVDSAT
ncbi:TRAP transporter small permease [Alsobacter sp. SYSU M60028]|uniref:TRAP transporter small permease protein n=1 Tax=Alsobacter ponti TaxID=2962936 RepID=A0ABT1LBX0_9HYPH|nr:TRAP transporter small permease [Alsobacter ponti]MCP8937758.1 TRAP transporter small permease [Alsobacter ponti]